MNFSRVCVNAAVVAMMVSSSFVNASRMQEVVMPVKMKAYSYKAMRVEGQIARTKESLKHGPMKCDEKTGMAGGEFNCTNMDLVSFVDYKELGTRFLGNDLAIDGAWVSDIWGWVDPSSGYEYALVSMWDGFSIVDISIPHEPKTVGFVVSPVPDDDGFDNIWRDIKVVNNVAYIGSEVAMHGIQVFDLSRLASLPLTEPGDEVPLLEADYVATEIGNTHNLVAAPAANKIMGTGMKESAYACAEDKGGSLAIYDVSGENALAPVLQTCFYGAKYVHDAHCVMYDGPDKKYKGVNICALFAETDIYFLNLDTYELINNFTYPDFGYVHHQGWFSEDFATLYAADEVDEILRTGGGPSNGNDI
jgi:choice-of-anchor B domain-containing protein